MRPMGHAQKLGFNKIFSSTYFHKVRAFLVMLCFTPRLINLFENHAVLVGTTMYCNITRVFYAKDICVFLY